MNQDLTVGNPSAALRKFCLPLFGSILFQQLYNIADSFVAGKFIGWGVSAVMSLVFYLVDCRSMKRWHEQGEPIPSAGTKP